MSISTDSSNSESVRAFQLTSEYYSLSYNWQVHLVHGIGATQGHSHDTILRSTAPFILPRRH